MSEGKKSIAAQLMYAIGGAVVGMLVGYLFADDPGRRTEVPSQETKSVMTTPTASSRRRVEFDDSAVPEKRCEERKKSTERAADPSSRQVTEEKKEEPTSHASVTEESVSGEDVVAEEEKTLSSETTFDRFHGWSKWNSSSIPYSVHKNVRSLEDCEALCAQQEKCTSATLINRTCGLFGNDSTSDLQGETNFSAVTSVKMGTGKVCHGPVPMMEGKPHLRPHDAPCYASEATAVNTVLKNAQPLSVFAPLFFGSKKRDAFHL